MILTLTNEYTRFIMRLTEDDWLNKIPTKRCGQMYGETGNKIPEFPRAKTQNDGIIAIAQYHIATADKITELVGY